MTCFVLTRTPSNIEKAQSHVHKHTTTNTSTAIYRQSNGSNNPRHIHDACWGITILDSCIYVQCMLGSRSHIINCSRSLSHIGRYRGRECMFLGVCTFTGQCSRSPRKNTTLSKIGWLQSKGRTVCISPSPFPSTQGYAPLSDSSITTAASIDSHLYLVAYLFAH